MHCLAKVHWDALNFLMSKFCMRSKCLRSSLDIRVTELINYIDSSNIFSDENVGTFEGMRQLKIFANFMTIVINFVATLLAEWNFDSCSNIRSIKLSYSWWHAHLIKFSYLWEITILFAFISDLWVSKSQLMHDTGMKRQNFSRISK